MITFILKAIGVILGCMLVFILTVHYLRSCNEAVIDSVKDIPVVSRIVPRIVKKMPKKVHPREGDKVLSEGIVERSKPMWNVRADIGIGIGTTTLPKRSDIIPKVGLGVSIASYGKNKMDTKYRFGRVGVQTNMKDLEVTLAPVMVRLGNENKRVILSNTYIYPYIAVNPVAGSIGGGIGLSVSF